ncbi:MAG: hypothetical protein WD906_05560 [Anaerolineales bacterium]
MDRKSPVPIVAALRIGGFCSIAAVLLSLVGLVERLDERDIIAGIISLGQAFLVAASVLAGFLIARQHGRQAAGGGLLFSAVAGAIPGIALGLLLVVGEQVDLRAVLINASPDLYGILSFGLPSPTAFLVLTGIGAILGAAGGLIQQMPAAQRGVILRAVALIGTLGVLQDLIRVIVTNLGLLRLFSWMFGSGGLKGLSIPGVLGVSSAYVLVLLSTRSIARRRALRPRVGPLSTAARLGPYVGIAAAVLISPWILGQYMSEVFNQVGLFILMGLGLNIVVGFAGLLDLGYVAFFAIGAYTVGVLTSTAIGVEAGQIVWGPTLPFFAALPVAVVVAILAGVLLGVPVLRMRGDYLAIVTLGFGEITRIMALSDFLKPYIGGSQGIVEVAPIQIGPFGGSDAVLAFSRPQMLFYVILIACCIVAFIAFRLKDSRIGRAWMAMREDEDVSQAVGLNLVSTKLLAFAAGAAFSGLAGALFASKVGTIYPHSFQLLVSLNILSLIILGGMGSIPGVVIGAFALVGLPELLREFAEYRLLVYGAVLIGMMLLRPEGLLPEEFHRRELRADATGPPAEPGV